MTQDLRGFSQSLQSYISHGSSKYVTINNLSIHPSQITLPLRAVVMRYCSIVKQHTNQVKVIFYSSLSTPSSRFLAALPHRHAL